MAEKSPRIKTTTAQNAHIDRLLDDIDEVMRLLLGDGQPGVLERLTRMEEAVKRIDGISTSTAETLKDTHDMLDEHINNKDLHSARMFLNKTSIAGIVILFSVIHFLLENDFYILRGGSEIFIRWLETIF